MAKNSNKMPIKRLSTVRKIADKLWSLAVRADWDGRCAVCSNPRVHAHHLVPKARSGTRYDLRNGIALCASHHVLDPQVSPHLNAAAWMAFLEEHYPATHAWYVEHKDAQFSGTRNAEYYCTAIRALREYVEDYDYRTIVGQRFADWLDEQTEEEEA